CKDHVFDSGARLLSLLDRYTSRREVTWLIAHNVAYHLTVGELWVHALSGEPLVEGYHFEGRTMSARLRIKGKLLHCVDAANYLDRPWEWVCSALRMPAPQEYGSDDTDSLALDKARLQVAPVTEPCPVRLLGQSVGASPARLHEGLIGGELAIARVTVDARNYDYPYRLWPGQSAPPAGGSTLPPYMARTTQWRRVWGRGKFTCV